MKCESFLFIRVYFLLNSLPAHVNPGRLDTQEVYSNDHSTEIICHCNVRTEAKDGQHEQDTLNT